MKKHSGKLTFAYMITAGAVMGLGGCELTDPASGVYGPPESLEYEDDTDEPMEMLYGPPAWFDEEDAESEDIAEGHYIGTFYSDDGTVSIVQDFDAGTAVIVDGDEEIPVEISDGVYGPRIMKCDIDGDGEDEYVISECEGTGTGFSTRGLCIIEKTDSEYILTRYDWNYFAEILNSRFSYSYDPDENKLRFYIENSDKNLEFFVAFEGDDKLEEVVFTDIVDVYFADGKVYLSAALGLIFEGHGYPDYEQGIEPYAPITVDTESEITVGDFTVI
jgi:hypothetical protein